MPDPSVSSPTKPQSTHWLSTWAVYLKPPALRMLALGFSAGLPLLLVLGTLSFRLREVGIDRATIGYLSWVGLAYGFKWLWAPLVDRLALPGLTAHLGRRRSWLLASQLLLVLALLGIGWSDPREHMDAVVLWALLAAWASATQDIALDAYRIESSPVEQQAALAASYQTGYRLAMIWAGAGVLWLAADLEGRFAGETATGAVQLGWQWAYTVMAASMLVGVLTVCFSPEPKPLPLPAARSPSEWLTQTLIEPFADFWLRYRQRALMILAMVAVYRISDVVMGIMANPFYVDMGYSKTEVANVTKVYGVIMTLLGAYVGGVLAQRLGVMRVLMLGAVLSAASNVLFAWLWWHGRDVGALMLVVSADNLSGGIASAAFIAYLSSLTNIRYSATQYALLSSMMLLLPKFIAGFSGQVVDAWGYPAFFMATALLGLPVLLLVAWTARAEVVSIKGLRNFTDY